MFNDLMPLARMEYIRFHYGCYIHQMDKRNIISMHAKYITTHKERSKTYNQRIIAPHYRKMMVAMVDFFP